MFRFCSNHLQGQSDTSKTQRYSLYMVYICIYKVYTYIYGIYMPTHGATNVKITNSIGLLSVMFYSVSLWIQFVFEHN